MSVKSELEKVLLIGSGPIRIGQAAEFDYSGSQACRAIQEEGLDVVLVNSNPATIMTDPEMADSVYVEPLEVESLKRIVEKERPDGVAAGLGGQTGLNLAAELAEQGVLENFGVEMLGTPVETIYESEDRDRFKEAMEDIGQPVARSRAVNNLEEARGAAEKLGLPVIVRPAYTLGGSGGGRAENMEKLEEIAAKGLELSRIDQVLIEESVAGWKEFEYEVMRDSADTCLTVVNMENFDPMGIHTGESIVIAPSQTLSDREHQKLRTAAIEIIRELGVEGGCNIQFAVNPENGDYRVVEVNPRVSRSSALASKATGYPIARVAAQIAIGKNLREIPNKVTGETPASFEPSVDYTVVKMPKWPFEKFGGVEKKLTTQMKSTGEVMGIGRNLEEAFQKAVRSLDNGRDGLAPVDRDRTDSEKLRGFLRRPTDWRKFAVYDALRGDYDTEEVSEITGVSPFWLRKFEKITEIERGLKKHPGKWIQDAKEAGFSDADIAALGGLDEERVRGLRREKTKKDYKMVDTCAAEFRARTPYFYSTFQKTAGSLSAESETSYPRKEPGGEKVLILGSGPIRIGQGIEFDYCCVHALEALREEKVTTLILNNNPETVSTDFDVSDRLYFDPLALEDVMNLIEEEEPDGVMVQFGGQTSVNLAPQLAEELEKRNEIDTEIYGTPAAKMEEVEDRGKFREILDKMDLNYPRGTMAENEREAHQLARELGFPLLVRPSHVIGGRAMEIVGGSRELDQYLREVAEIDPEHPLLVEGFLEDAVEIDVDAAADGDRVLIGGVMEHIDRAGVHSGDSACVTPPQTIGEETEERLRRTVKDLARELEAVGLLNVQLAVKGGEIYVLEANPRASRTVPYISKATGVPLTKVAAKAMVGKKLSRMDYEEPKEMDHVAVKEVVFPFEKFPAVDPLVGPEMKSTGEVMGIGYDFGQAYYKAKSSAKEKLPLEGNVFLSLRDGDKDGAVPIAKGLERLGMDLYATSGTAERFRAEGLEVHEVPKISQDNDRLLEMIKQGELDLVINTPTSGGDPRRDGFKIRRAAVEFQVPVVRNLESARAALQAIKSRKSREPALKEVEDY